MTVDAIREWYAAGMRFFLYQYDYRLFRDACSRSLTDVIGSEPRGGNSMIRKLSSLP